MTKETLEQYLWLTKNIALLEDRLYVLETRAQKMTSHLTHEARGGGFADKLGCAISAIIECQDEINDKLSQVYALEVEIEQGIKNLPEREKYLLRLRYIQGWQLKAIAKEMHYSLQHLIRIERGAINLINANANDVSQC